MSESQYQSLYQDSCMKSLNSSLDIETWVIENYKSFLNSIFISHMDNVSQFQSRLSHDNETGILIWLILVTMAKHPDLLIAGTEFQ